LDLLPLANDEPKTINWWVEALGKTPVSGISERSFMQLVNQRTGAEEDALALEVMLVHEDLPAGRRGKEVLDQVALNLESKADFLVNPWNFEMLHNPTLQGQAVQDAAHADIVVLSAHGRAKLPAAVRAWLEVWLDRRGDSPCALVVSLDASVRESSEANPMLKYVNALAWQAGVEVFPHFGVSP
jgi:hypothetical protein